MSVEMSPELLEIDVLLRRASREFVYPQTPRVSEGVAARLRSEPSGPSPFERLFAVPVARAASAALLVLAAIIGASIAVPQSRGALADFLGLNSVRVDRMPYAGPTPPVLSPNSFARPATIEEARAAVAFPLRLYERDGVRYYPNAVYIGDAGSTAAYPILVYDDFDLYEREGGFFGKGGPDPSLIHEIEFDGLPALWIDQGGHIAETYDAEGRLIVESVRTVERATLLWERDGVAFRLETSLSQAEAIEVARSLR
jgi:hypothetical protein